MTGISSKALNGIAENKKKYQQYEFNSDFDINLYESFYRTHDPQIGRFLQLDPKPNDLESPYVAMGNNPIKNIDILGDTAIVGAGFFQNVWEGIKAGGIETGSFIKSLGTAQGWKNIGNGLLDMGHRLNPLSPYGQLKNTQSGEAVVNYIANVPNMTKDQIGYDIGYGLEKGAEAIVVSKGTSFAAKGLTALNEFAATKYLSATGNLSSFSKVEGFSLRLGSKDFVYHNSIGAAKNTPWSSPVSFSSSPAAFNGLALGYKGTTNFAQMKFSITNIGVFVKGTTSAKGVTLGGSTQLLRTPLSLGINVKKLGFSF